MAFQKKGGTQKHTERVIGGPSGGQKANVAKLEKKQADDQKRIQQKVPAAKIYELWLNRRLPQFAPEVFKKKNSKIRIQKEEFKNKKAKIIIQK